MNYLEREKYENDLLEEFHIDDCHGQFDPTNLFKGSYMFQSKNAFEGHTLSRRDDIISLIYLLIYLESDSFPVHSDKLSKL